MLGYVASNPHFGEAKHKKSERCPGLRYKWCIIHNNSILERKTADSSHLVKRWQTPQTNWQRHWQILGNNVGIELTC